MCVAIVTLLVAHAFLLVGLTVFHLPLPALVRRTLDLNADGGLASIFSAVSLILSAALLALVGADAKSRRSWETRHWFTLAGVVVLLAVAHTGFARVLPTSNSAMQGPLISGGFRAYRWMLSYLAFTAVLVPLFYPFMRRLPTATRRDFLLSSGSYVAANFVSEALERLPMPSGVLVSLAIAMIAVAARAIVLLAIAYFVAAIVSHIEARGRSLEFRISLPNVREADREVPLPPWQQADRERRSEPREIRQ